MDNNNIYQQPAPVVQQSAPSTPQQPVQAPAKKSPAGGVLGKQHIFIGVAILLGSGIIPAILGAINSAIGQLITNSVGYYDNSYVSLFNLTSSIYTVVLTLVTLVIYALFGYLAYKKLPKAACFIGVAFVATKLSGFITGIITVFLNLIGVIVNAIDSYAYTGYLAVQGVLSTLVSIFGVILSVAAGIFLLMIVEKGKLNIKKKNKKAPVQAPVQQTFVQN